MQRRVLTVKERRKLLRLLTSRGIFFQSGGKMVDMPKNTYGAGDNNNLSAPQQLNAILAKPVVATKTPETTPLATPIFYIRH